MKLSDLNKYSLPISEFSLKWRLTDSRYDLLTEVELKQIIPLNIEASNYLHSCYSELTYNELVSSNLELFLINKEIIIENYDEDKVSKWLKQLNVNENQPIYLSWDKITGAMTNWNLLVKYWDTFYYPGSDDLIVFCENRNWLLFFSHAESIHWKVKRM
ncbi:MAG: hypothetical protein SCALA702_01500 [Melioribacteraceae bacterium]|nr:MAG: hypothetical protein SCALA702_01500 [Melioribacteraceae bacterium]